MRVTTGKVVDGRIEVDEENLAEGMTVTVVAPEGDGSFELGSKEEADLLAAIAEGDQDKVISAEDLLRELGRER